MTNNTIGRLIGVLFMSRDTAHREHLKTNSYAQHKALNEFYDEVIDLADTLTETYQGRHGIIDISLAEDKATGTPADKLAKHLDWIEANRYDAIDKKDTALHNIVDEIVGLYLQTLYKLRNLK